MLSGPGIVTLGPGIGVNALFQRFGFHRIGIEGAVEETNAKC